MTEVKNMSAPAEPGTPPVDVRRRRGPSVVWLIPLIAIVVAGGLIYRTVTGKGPAFTITFETADGVEPGKTPIKYKSMQIGVVESVAFTEDQTHVILHARLDRSHAALLRENTQFWVVRPRLGLTEVSGLGTIISGSYLDIQLGDGAPSRSFAGLEDPPPVADDEPGVRLVLHAAKVGSLSQGEPVYHHGFRVGQVERCRLSPDDRGAEIDVFVHSPHDQLVRTNTRFWNASGLAVTLDADGIRARMESVETLIAGGVAFGAPPDGDAGGPVETGATFRLYASRAEMLEDVPHETMLTYVMYFSGSVRGLQVGAPVDLRGIPIGSVTQIVMQYDADDRTVRIPVLVEIEPDNVVGLTGGGAAEAQQAISRLVEHGLRAQLKTGSLLTGELFVELEFHPETPATLVGGGGPHPELPTLPSMLEAFGEKASGILTKVEAILDKVEALPLEKLASDTDTLIEQASGLLADLDREIGPFLANVEGTSDQAKETLKTLQDVVDPDSPMIYDLNLMLEELATAARSIRVLAAYLERHPDALIYGKGSGGN